MLFEIEQFSKILFEVYSLEDKLVVNSSFFAIVCCYFPSEIGNILNSNKQKTTHWTYTNLIDLLQLTYN